MSPAVIEGEIAKLENRTGRLDAESSLRVAILPPLLAIYLYLVVVDSWWWIFAGVFLPSLLIQAFLRTRDYEVARRALWELRRRFGLPPRSVGEEGEAEASLGSG